jgi:hypothetical protein
MKQPLHLAVECLMAAKKRPVDLADMDGSTSALCKALHKADYAKSLIMESSESERTPIADWQRQARIPTFT